MHWGYWLSVALAVSLVICAATVAARTCRLIPAKPRRHVRTEKLGPAQRVVSRQSVMDRCDLVVDVMYAPKFWSSINSAYLNTLEMVIARINAEPRTDWRVYIPMPILNASHRTLLRDLGANRRVSIVSNTGDETMRDEVFSELTLDNRVARIYVNNVPLTFPGHPKVSFVPIGFCQDNYVRSRVGSRLLFEVNLKRLPLARYLVKNHPGINVLDVRPKRPLRDKKPFVMCAFSNTGSEWTVPTLRRDAREWLSQQPFGVVLPFMEKSRYFAKHEEFAFELSPFGNGLDCFRHWECLLLHTIPIVFDSPVNAVFRDLPVLIVKDFRDITPALLAETQARYADYFETHDIREELAASKWL